MVFDNKMRPNREHLLLKIMWVYLPLFMLNL